MLIKQCIIIQTNNSNGNTRLNNRIIFTPLKVQAKSKTVIISHTYNIGAYYSIP